MEEKKLNLNSKKIEEYIKIIKKIKESQIANNNDYNLGMNNGIELCLSIFEDREPNYALFNYTYFNQSDDNKIQDKIKNEFEKQNLVERV